MSERAVFLDLNGTLVAPVTVDRLDQLSIIPGVGNSVARLTAAAFVCPVITVQSRIAKGVFTLAEFESWFHTFARVLGQCGAIVVGPYVCPHRFRDRCECKKPNPFLYERASEDLGIDLSRSFVIGDSADDMEAATRFSGRGCLVRTGWASDESEVVRAKPFASLIGWSVEDAVNWILTQGS
jgi:histidinol-phosphate phosphatase family protein